ncbi:MAG: LysR family transcriptional regulator [Bacilli bacterium]|nr:LysR family transcriptional regulator [Bacilli bacterium]
MIKLIYVRYFVSTVETGSLTETARIFDVSQPAISYAIKELEKAVGLPLFTKVGKKLVLTPDGKKIYAILSPTLEKWDSSMNRVVNYCKSKTTLTIAVPMGTNPTTLMSTLSDFSSKYPEIKFNLKEMVCVEAREQVQNEDIDIAFSVYPEGFDLPNMVHEEMKEIEMRYLVGLNHPLANKEEVTMEEIAQGPIVLFAESSPISEAIKDSFKKMGINPNIVMSTTQMKTIMEVINYGSVGSFAWPSKVLLDNKDVKLIPIKDLGIRFLYGYFYLEKKELNQSEKTLLDFVKA